MSVPLRRQLQLLSLLTGIALMGKMVSLAAPMPLAEAPANLQLPGYDIRQLPVGAEPRQGRELSQGRQRVFRLVPRSGEAPLTLRLMPVRSRRGSEVSEETDLRNGLNMEAVAAQEPTFSLSDRRFLSLGSAQPKVLKPINDQIALGRAPDDPPGSITRLQTCLSPTGLAGLYGSILVPENQKLERAAEPGWTRHLRRLTGLSEPRYECLAVQLESEKGNSGAGAVDRRKALERAWLDLRGSGREQGRPWLL
ncbi:MAG: hypothetical protein VKL58_03285 [Cyanobacteriota bacterium]|nr:hypothetical protein [Cyanobacteriota bacterium]